jgi:hypothetical protein
LPQRLLRLQKYDRGFVLLGLIGQVFGHPNLVTYFYPFVLASVALVGKGAGVGFKRVFFSGCKKQHKSK